MLNHSWVHSVHCNCQNGCNQKIFIAGSIQYTVAVRMAAIRKYKANQPLVRPVKCYWCQPYSIHRSRADLHIHKSTNHRERYGGAQLQDHPWPPDVDPFAEFPVLDEIREIYFENEIYILNQHSTDGLVMRVFNFPLRGHVTNMNIDLQMRYIYNHPSVTNAYRVQIAAGVILYHRTDRYYRYFRPSSNMYLIEDPYRIWNQPSLEAAIRNLSDSDLDTLIRNFRPASDFNVLFITNLEYYVFLTDFPLRNGRNNECSDALPSYINNCHAIATGFKDPKYRNCCVLVALAQHFNPESDQRYIVRKLHQLYAKWRQYSQNNRLDYIPPLLMSEFRGVYLGEISKLEECFEVKITIMRKKPDGSVSTEHLSQASYNDQVYMNLYQDHVNLIRHDRLNQYAKAYACKYCAKLFDRLWHCTRHEKSCMKMTKTQFGHGFFKYARSLFDRLEYAGICVPHELRRKKHFTVFDTEAILEIIDESAGRNLKFTRRHKIVSAAYASSVPGFRDTRCILDRDPKVIIDAMFNYFDEVRREAVRLEMICYEGYIDELEHKLIEEKRRVLASADKTLTIGDKRRKQLLESDPLVKMYAGLLKDFYMFISQHTIYGYNSGKYDLVLIADLLVLHLREMEAQHGNDNEPWIEPELDDSEDTDEFMTSDTSELSQHWSDLSLDSVDVLEADREDIITSGFDPTFMAPGKFSVVKKGRTFIAVYNSWYRFNDIMLFLPPGTSFDQFLQVYESPVRKFWFPYEHITSYEALLQPLPPYPSQAWFSRLKNCDLLSSEHQKWKEQGESGPPPLTGPQKYEQIVRVWQEENMKDLRCLLRYYNMRDVEPAVGAVERLHEEFFNQGVDVCTESCTVAGVSRRVVFKYAQKQNIVFPQIPRSDADLHYLIKSSICGGISVISKRLAEKDVTYLTPEQLEKTCFINSLDSNSLYLYTLKSKFSTKVLIRRMDDNNYKPQFNPRIVKQHAWLMYVQRCRNIHISSAHNSGQEVHFGKYAMDGVYSCPSTGALTAFEFKGKYSSRLYSDIQ